MLFFRILLIQPSAGSRAPCHLACGCSGFPWPALLPTAGIYYHYLTSDLLLGSQPRSPGDVAHLAKDEGVDAILNLQQDRDLRHWGVDLASLRHAASEHGVQYMRAPAVDFDPGSLRHALPTAVGMLLEALSQGRRVFVHCTAGLGRAPAACIAAIYWAGLGVLPARDGLVRLEDAYKYVTDIRPCGPNQVRRGWGLLPWWKGGCDESRLAE